MRDSSIDLTNRRPSLARQTNKSFDSQTSLKTLSEKVSSILSSCRICLSSIFDPAALTCGHRFCERCLDKYWRVGEKPDCIVCPLCRACAFNVDFAQTEKGSSTEDFRKMFSPIIVNKTDVNIALMWYLKISAVIPAMYFLLKWLKPSFVQLLTCLYL